MKFKISYSPFLMPGDVIILANDDVTVDSLREMVRTIAQTDSRFLKKPDGPSAIPSSIWVGDLIAPSATAGWKAIIYAADNKTYEVSFTVADGNVTLADDAKEVVRTVGYQALTNMADVVDVITLDNVYAPDVDGWALLAPFGEHRKSRYVQKNGQLILENYVQILDPASVDAVVANEKGTNIFQKLKRAIVKRPIYLGHPDLKLYSPETVTAGNDKMIPLGVNDGCRKTVRGLEFRPILAPEGAEAVAEDGAKYPSAVFLLKKTGITRPNGDIEVRPFALASVGLTGNPNISGVDSLANANLNKPAAKTTETQIDNTMKQLLIGWLAANGVVLANNADDQVVWEKFLAEQSTRAAATTALGNTKTQLEAATGDKAKLVAGATLPVSLVDAGNQIFALANAQETAKAMTKKFVEARVDLCIAEGKMAVADREAEVTKLLALANDKLDGELANLKTRQVKFKVGDTTVDGSRKNASTNSASARQQIIALANSDPKYSKLSMPEAWEAIKRDQPALFEQLNAKPEGNASPATT